MKNIFSIPIFFGFILFSCKKEQSLQPSKIASCYITKQTIENESGKNNSVVEYKYNSEGVILEEATTQNGNTTIVKYQVLPANLNSTTEPYVVEYNGTRLLRKYYCNNKKQVIKEEYFINNEVFDTGTYEYDSKDFPIKTNWNYKENEDKFNGEINSVFLNGNRIKRSFVEYKNGIIETQFDREFIYYEEIDKRQFNYFFNYGNEDKNLIKSFSNLDLDGKVTFVRNYTYTFNDKGYPITNTSNGSTITYEYKCN